MMASLSAQGRAGLTYEGIATCSPPEMSSNRLIGSAQMIRTHMPNKFPCPPKTTKEHDDHWRHSPVFRAEIDISTAEGLFERVNRVGRICRRHASEIVPFQVVVPDPSNAFPS